MASYVSPDVSSTASPHEEDEDVLVAAFEAAAGRLSGTEVCVRDAQRLLRVCGRLIEELFAAGSLDAIGQRYFWRELLCRRWSEGAASLALELLLLKAQLTCITRGEKVGFTEADEILAVVAFAYAHLPVDLKECCIDQVSALISAFIHEGPTHQFTPRMVLQLRLLECLTSCHFLDESGELDASAWLDEYFPACFDCCGVAIQLLNDYHQPGPWTSRANVSVGVIRMLDMCLLVIKAGFDFFETRRKDIEDLARILSPVIASSLVHLASFSPTCSPEMSKGACPEAIQMRSVETSLHLLSKMASVVQESEYDALVGVFKLLLTPNMVSRIGCVRPSLVSACFDAIHQLVSHSKVAEVVGTPLATLLQANDISELYEGYKKTRQIRSTRDRDSGCSGCANSDRASESNFPDRTVATVLSGMDLDESGVAALKDHASALSRNQPSSAVLRPDAPQWFDEEDSSDNDSALEEPCDESSKGSDQRVTTLQAEVAVPQWFDDEDYEEGEAAGVDLPPADSRECPELAFLLGSDDCAAGVSNASDDEGAQH